MDWFKKHVDAAIVLTAIVGSVLWMSSKFSEMDKRFAKIEQDLAVMKTILLMKDIMPKELASKNAEIQK